MKLVENNIKPRKDSAGNFPMYSALMASLESYEVSFTLLPLPSKGHPNPKRPAKRPKLTHPNTEDAKQTPAKGKGKFKSSGKGKGSGQQPWIAIPKFIQDLGGVATMPSG